MMPALAYGIPLAAGALTSWWGKKQKKGNPIQSADMFQRWLSTQTPAMANKFYQSMMGGAMGRNLRMNAMGSNNALMGSLRNSQSGNMNNGLAQLGQGLGASNYFNLLSQGQGQMGELAWQHASPLTMAAMQGGIGRADKEDEFRRRMMAAGFGTMGTAMGDLSRDKNPDLWKWS